MEKHQNIKNSLILAQKYTEPLVFSCYKSKDNVESPPAPTTIVTDPETHPSTAGSTQKLENSPISTQKTPFPPISKRFDWADDAAELPTPSIVPTKHPRDLSCLRSTTTHPFSSLRRRRGRPKNRQNPQHCHSHWHSSGYSYPWHHSLHPHNPFPASLNWDQDPRLLDLSNALKALGWVRQ